MEIEHVKKVMEKYARAWETRDPELILACFTPEGVYQESPLSAPYCGHDEIELFWNRVREDTNEVKFRLGECYVSADGNTGFAEWQCDNTYKGEVGRMVGIAILKMEGEKITYLNEYWNTRRPISSD